MSDEPLSPACAPCRWGKGTCFPGPCLLYRARLAKRYAKALEDIATEASDGLPEFTPQAMVSIAKRALKGERSEPFDLRQSPQYHPGDLA